MRVFVTGASGWIGSAVVPDLIAAGHRVIGLARSEEAANALAAAGATPQRGDLTDLDSLRAGAAAAEGVIHLAFRHDIAFSGGFAAASESDRRAIEALGEALAGSGGPLVIASGILGLAPGRLATERDTPDPAVMGPRAAGARAALALAERGVRPSLVRLAPSVHGEGDYGFLAALVGIARERGAAGYIGDGANRWPAVHRRDAATLFRLALESAPSGAALHGVAEEGIPMRTIAEAIGRQLNVPTVSVAPEEAGAHFGWLGGFIGFDAPASSALTRESLGWQPNGPGLLDDLERGYYTRG